MGETRNNVQSKSKDKKEDTDKINPLLRHIIKPTTKISNYEPLFEPNHFNKPTPRKVVRKVRNRRSWV